jgi:hypothetical protein
MAKFSQGKYTVKNPQKYVGKGQPTYRSSWELTFMMFCDNNEHVVQWASEPISIPYRNPLTNKRSNYVPDFFVTYRDKKGRQISEVVEIKPKGQSMLMEKMNERQKATVAVNYAKWEAAQAWCKQNKLKFRVVTEDDIYRK